MNNQPIQSVIEEQATIVTEITTLPSLQTTVEEVPAIQTIVDSDKTPIETQVLENESSIVSLVNQPTVQVTSVNGKTGDVTVDSEVNEYKKGYYYKKGSIATYNGSAYIAKQSFTAGDFNLSQWGPIGGGTQSDWNDTNTSSLAFIKNKPNIPAIQAELQNKANKTEVFTKTESNSSFAPKTHTHAFNTLTGIPTNMSSTEANSGIQNTPRLISSSTLKSAVNYHQAQPDWNASSGKGAILNKPVIPQVDSSLKFVTGMGLNNQTPTTLNVTVKNTAGEMGSLEVDLSKLFPKTIYGMVRARRGGAAQVVNANTAVEMLWDDSRKEEHNITFLGEGNGSNAWEIPEDGIYYIYASAEMVDAPNPFALSIQANTTGSPDRTGATWRVISPIIMSSYQEVGRGVVATAIATLYKGDLVNCRVRAFSGNTRIGEYDTDWLSSIPSGAYFSICRLGVLN